MPWKRRASESVTGRWWFGLVSDREHLKSCSTLSRFVAFFEGHQSWKLLSHLQVVANGIKILRTPSAIIGYSPPNSHQIIGRWNFKTPISMCYSCVTQGIRLQKRRIYLWRFHHLWKMVSTCRNWLYVQEIMVESKTGDKWWTMDLVNKHSLCWL